MLLLLCTAVTDAALQLTSSPAQCPWRGKHRQKASSTHCPSDSSCSPCLPIAGYGGGFGACAPLPYHVSYCTSVTHMALYELDIRHSDDQQSSGASDWPSCKVPYTVASQELPSTQVTAQVCSISADSHIIPVSCYYQYTFWLQTPGSLAYSKGRRRRRAKPEWYPPHLVVFLATCSKQDTRKRESPGRAGP